MIGFFRAHKRLIAITLVLAYASFLLIQAITYPRRSDELFDGAAILILIATQVYWVRCVRELGKKLAASKPWRKALGTGGLIVYLFLGAFAMFNGENEDRGTHLTVQTALLEVPLHVWITGSLLGFPVVMVVWVSGRVTRAVGRAFKKWIIPRRHAALAR